MADLKQNDQDEQPWKELPTAPFERDCWVLHWTSTPEDHDGDPNWRVEGVYLTYEAVEDAEAELHEELEGIRTRHGSRKSPTKLHVPEEPELSWSVPSISRAEAFDAYSTVRQEALTEVDGFRAGMEHGARRVKEILLGGSDE